MKSLCVYCGSNPGLRPVYQESARAFGTEIAERGLSLIYGGGRVGLMGAVADGALSAGGSVIGIMPENLIAKGIAHVGLTELHSVSSMHERKAAMASLADAFVALPGGAGTLEEIFEAITWSQLGLHTKACGLLNVEEYYTPLLGFLRHAAAERFMRTEYMDALITEESPSRLLDRFAEYEHVHLEKWLDRGR